MAFAQIPVGLRSLEVFTRRTTVSSRSLLQRHTGPKTGKPRNKSDISTSSSSPQSPETTPLSEPAKPNAPSPTPHPTTGTPIAPTTPTPTPPPTTTATGTPPATLTLTQSIWRIVKASPAGKLASMYARGQRERPYTMQVGSYILVYLCGDLSAQLLFPADSGDDDKHDEEKKEDERAQDGNVSTQSAEVKYDPWRTFRHILVGIGSSIPTYKWFMYLHYNFNYASKYLSLLTKVFVSQMIYTPIFNAYFFAAQSLLAGAGLMETYERLKVALPQSIRNSVKLWPAVTAFSFTFIAPEYRSVFGGLIAVGWQTYLSWLNQEAAKEVLDYDPAPALDGQEHGREHERVGLMGSAVPVSLKA
ncbi:hypothetical protein MAP00_009170 [Monascus purpureus]|nr:hypothetical protein MAP00_009170 [Monascus purpureus]